MGHFDRYWELREGGPYDDEGESEEIFKCTDCGAQTHHPDGYNGEPNTDACHAGCASRASDWRPGRVSPAFVRNIGRVAFDNQTPIADAGAAEDEKLRQRKNFVSNFDNTFPDAPGAGI